MFLVLSLAFILVSCDDLQFPFLTPPRTALNGPAWQKQTRSVKLNTIWKLITKDTTPRRFPTLVEQGEVFLESMNVSLETNQDDFPKQFLTVRRKMVHSVGPVVLVRYVPVPNPFNYTGIFKTGSDSAIMRFSAAVAPIPFDPRGVTPAVAIKFLRDQIPSANGFAMRHFASQFSWNFFKHDWSNHPPDFGVFAEPELIALKLKFNSASEWPFKMGLAPIAKFDQDGNPEPTVSFPYRWVIHPNNRIRTATPDGYSLRTPWATQICKVLNTVGESIFSVWAEDVPGAQLVKIGEFITTSVATTTKFGDVSLFYKHNKMEEDFEYYPEWLPIARAERLKQIFVPNFQHPDLPPLAGESNRAGSRQEQTTSGSGPNVGLIVGLTVGAVCALLLVGALVGYVIIRRRRETQETV